MSRKHLALFIAPVTTNDRHVIYGVIDFVRQQDEWEIDTFHGVPSLLWELHGQRRGDWAAVMRTWKGDGIIAAIYSPEQHAVFQRKRIPIVNVVARVETPRIASVYSDNQAIGRCAAEHLLELGLRQFAFFGWRELYHDRERQRGFQDTLKRHGFECRCFNMDTAQISASDIRDIQMIGRCLASMEYPVGVLAAHDPMACLVVEACRREDIKVPYQVAVLGVGNDDLVCETTRPPLTSVAQRSEEIGYEAARLLDKISRGEASRDTQIRLPPGVLAKRRSTQLVIAKDPLVAEVLRWIHENAAEPLTVEDLAEKVAVSRRHLDKRFLEDVGHSPVQEIRMARIRLAQSLLSGTDLGMLAISVRSGFQSACSFYRAFQDQVGMTPREYRRQNNRRR